MKRAIVAISALLLFTSFTERSILSWMAIGDSITYLNDHLAETGNRITKGYMTRVTEKLRHIRFKNYGHSGWTASRMANAFDKQGIEKADIYTIYYGTNDWNSSVPIGSLDDYRGNTGAKTLYGSYRLMVDKIRKLNSNAKILLITPMQRVDFVSMKNFKNNAKGSYAPRNGRFLSEYADAILEIAKIEKFDVVDLYYKSGMNLKRMVKFKRLKDPTTGEYKNFKYPAFIDIPFNPETDDYPYPVEAIDLTYDGLHPSDKGMAVISKMLVKVMKKY
ncbi:SGNH/GDSL hydrolase family protein [Pedobacter sp. SYSU D00535]|uniref:SGNH/GDSL hydrolase family protein n=1 Tax=Pedobacter sp. SYSU D00535 TaxID=2810308 RepID=UPI001A96F468|nr:SGNH/GDSL hydrolase family protein [Pedobacter sp. SYSU D00535]